MKTFIVVFLIVLFVLSIIFYCSSNKDECKDNNKCEDERIKKIKRAKKNLHPTRNINVDRDALGRYCKKK